MEVLKTNLNYLPIKPVNAGNSSQYNPRAIQPAWIVRIGSCLRQKVETANGNHHAKGIPNPIEFSAERNTFSFSTGTTSPFSPVR